MTELQAVAGIYQLNSLDQTLSKKETKSPKPIQKFFRNQKYLNHYNKSKKLLFLLQVSISY